MKGEQMIETYFGSICVYDKEKICRELKDHEINWNLFQRDAFILL